MLYVGSPYSHPSEFVRKARHANVQRFINHLSAKIGVFAFSPIVYMHDMAQKFDWPYEAGHYMQFNLDMLRRADALFVVAMQGWEDSQGLRVELSMAKTLSIPIQFFTVDANEMANENNTIQRASTGLTTIADGK